MFRKPHNKAILALITANLIWGAASPIFKLSLENISPFLLAFIRFLGAALILLPFAFSKLNINKRDIPKLVLLSLFGITLNISFFFLGLKLSPSINAPIIASSGPVLLYIFSIFILKEKTHPKVLVGLLVSLLGVLIIVGQPIIENGFNVAIIGNLFFLLATVGTVGHAIVSKSILDRYEAVTITFWSFIIGSITFLPFAFIEIVNYNPLPALDYRGILGIIFGIFLSSALAYLLYEWGIKKIEAQEVGIFTYIDPVIAIMIAVPLLGEVVTTIFLLGSILIFLGIAIAEGRLHYHPIHKLRS
ncbi:hypothetical protein A2773_02550 [Candidatus Gottesmanbacteria bacterium RIFCSPHIGHO2_01_FULL_39_10]|uniref:EamA domain-containing protein n=1 Tax=Candidatus Gottesmanbacteria bacterium RIFCSPHIGHO2_01_FULL_39_10 TaxID=1798375 RepID=A0A1F5ZQH9_9BACT|nr:MAG: hypothetical protein A2773_02550 [Candidatus Gottesmanbacteria bacterium RIFCSPHIGHO2_01_FULL_39_10]